MNFRLSLLSAAAVAALSINSPAQAGNYSPKSCGNASFFQTHCAIDRSSQSGLTRDNERGAFSNHKDNGKDKGNEGGKNGGKDGSDGGKGGGNGGGNGGNGGGGGGEGGEGGS